jgi:hypothetical protein
MPKELNKWPDERLHRLALLWPDTSKSVQAIAKELATNGPAVKRRAKHLGLQGRPMSRDQPWLAARRELLRALAAK